MNTRSSHCCCVFAAVLLHSQVAGAQTPPTPPSAPTAPALPAAPPAKVTQDAVVKIGDTMKQTRVRVTDVDKGDNGCYLTIRDEKKNELIEVGTFALCSQKPPFKGKQVQLTFSMETIQAGDCYGDPKCKRTETVPVITAVSIIE